MIDAELICYEFMTDFNGPDRQYPNPFYPSGVYDGENPVYKYGPPSIEYPTLTLPVDLFDAEGNVIKNGFYTVTLSIDRKYILLYRGSDLVAKVRVVKSVEKLYTDEERNEENVLIAKVETAKQNKKLKKYREASEELEAFRARIKAQSYAQIEDSGEGYYVLNYNYSGIKAMGIIKK